MNIYKNSLIAISVMGLVACSDSEDTSELVNAVTLEAQRANGTIIESITFKGANVRLKKGQTQQLVAWGKDSKGDVRDITDEVEWSSSNESAATISKKGLITALNELTDDQGIVEFTAKTINGITAVAKISVSGISASSLELLEVADLDTEVNMCLDAQLGAKVTYEDGFISDISAHNITWSIENSKTANITDEGLLSTFGTQTEDISIIAEHSDGVTKEQSFKVITDNLSHIILKNGDDNVSQLQLNLSQRISLTAELYLIDESKFNITNSTTWESRDSEIVAVSNYETTKGNTVALSVGTTNLIASCGGLDESSNVAVIGDSTLESLKVNDGIEKITIERGNSVDLTLYADLKGLSEDLNVSEFAEWNLGATDLAKGEIKKVGTKDAYYELSANQNVSPGSFTLIIFYQGKSIAIPISII